MRVGQGKGIVVNFKITFQKMDVSEITDTLRSHIRAQMASAAGVSLPYVLIVSETPGSAIWEMDVIFPGENTGAAESFVSVLQTNVTSILAEDGIASDYGVAQTAVSR